MRLYTVLLICLLCFCACKKEVYYHAAAPEYSIDGVNWNKDRPVTGKQISRARIQVNIIRRTVPTGHLGIKVNAFGSYDMYWDGILLGKNGQPGTETARFLIPDSLSKLGRHVVTFRLSQSYQPKVLRAIEVDLQNYEPMLRDPLLIGMGTHLLAGIFLIASLYYFLLYRNSKVRKRATLVFSCCCLLFFTLLIVDYLEEYIAIPYTFYFVRYYTLSALTLAISLIIPYYFSIRFRPKYVKWYLSITCFAIGILVVGFYQEYILLNHLLTYAGWAASIAIATQAAIQRINGSKLVVAVLLLCALANYFLLYDIGLFVGYALIAACMLYLQTLQIKEQEREHEVAIQRSSRLKLELLKKQLQPHFIKNTLTSMIDWVEHSPKDGALFLHALAKEFDILNKIADETLIPIGTEIDLCQTHLKVMAFRKEINYSWEQSNIDPAERLPAAILHTMVENGITHSIPAKDNSVRFHLSFERDKTTKTYRLLITAQNRTSTRLAGTGFAYIRSRLTESYGTQWTFSSGAVPEGWLNTINISSNENIDR